MDILIRNALILPMTASANDPRKFFGGSVAISGGRISSVLPATPDNGSDDRGTESENRSRRVIDAGGKLLMPGLINLHNHVAMSLMRNYADDLPLMEWLADRVWPFEAKLTGDDVYLGARLGIAEMLLGGTTTFVDMYWHADRVAEAVLESGMRAVVCPAFIDTNYEAFERETVRLVERYAGADGGRLGVRIAPHAPYTCSPESVRKALSLCEKYGLGIHVHLSETRSETETIRQRYDKTSAEYLRDLGVFDYPTLAVHCVHLTEEDMDILFRYGVSVAYNPQSNMKLASGIAPVARMIGCGLTVGIGTDGPCSNNDLDMWDEMRTASLLQKVATGDASVLPAYETLRMATVGGACAVGMEGELGVVAPGARADLILVDMGGTHWAPGNDPIAGLVYNAKSTDVDTVLVDGRILVERGELIGTDTTALAREAGRRVEQIERR